MGLAGAKRSKCPRVLSPFEIAGERFNDDIVNNPLLVAWYDFSDNSNAFSIESGFVDLVEDGERIGLMYNACWRPLGGTATQTAALGSHILAPSFTWAPYWTAPTDTERGYVTFDGTGNALFGGATTGTATGIVSSTSIPMNDLAIVAVVKKDISTSSTMTLFTLYPKSGTQTLNWSYNSSHVLEFQGIDVFAGIPIEKITHPDADDGEFHYHYINCLPSFAANTNHGIMGSDGLWYGGGVYSTVDTSATQTSTMEFDNVSSNIFYGIGCKKGPASAGTSPSSFDLFKGRIYEIMVFRKSLSGGFEGMDSEFDRDTWKHVLHYLRRKYGYIRNIN
jgi:hypothetical protein